VFVGSPFRSGATLVVNFPEIISWGLAVRPSGKFTLALELEWVRWSSFNRRKLDLSHEAPQGQLSDMSLVFDGQDSFIITIAIEYHVNERLVMRGAVTSWKARFRTIP